MKNIITPENLVTNGSMASNITSNVLSTQMVDDIGIQLDWTGSPVGTVAIQVSLNYSVNPDGSVRNAGTWATLPTSAFSGTYPVPGTTTSPGFLDIPLTSATAIRVVYTASSGSGTLNVVAVAKGV